MDKERLHQYALNKITDISEVERIVSWIEDSPENQKEFNNIKNLWSYIDFSNYDAGINSASNHKKKVSTIGVIRLKMFKYAAIIMVSLLVGGALTFIAQHDFRGEIAYNEVIVPYGESAEVILPDKTHVWLSSGSNLMYPSVFEKGSRDITLSGEALFEVSHHPEQPFHVITPKLIVEVLGTTFNVEAFERSEYVNVTLIEGNVNIQDEKGKVLTNLNPNERALYNIHSKALGVSEINTDFYALWKQGIYSLDDERLGDIAIRLERMHNVKFIFDNEETKEIKFSGVILKNKPIEQILDVFKFSSGINYKIVSFSDKPNEIHLSKE